MAFSLDTGDVSVHIPDESDHRRESSSVVGQHQHRLSAYNPAIAPITASNTADNSRDQSRSHNEAKYDHNDTAGDETPTAPNSPTLRQPAATTPPALLSTLAPQRPLPKLPLPLEIASHHSPSKDAAHSSPSKSFPTGAVYPGASTYGRSSPVARARLQEHKIGAIEQRLSRESVCVRGLFGYVTVLLLLTIIAFVAGVYYLNHRDASPLSAGAVQTSMLANGAVTTPKLATGAVGVPELSSSIASLVADMNTTYQQAIGHLPTAGAGLAQNYTAHTLSVSFDPSTLTITASNTLTIAAGGVKASMLAAGAVGAVQLAAGSVGSAALAAGSVGVPALGNDVMALIGTLNANAMQAWNARPVAGAGVVVTGGSVSVNYDNSTLAVTSSNKLTIAPYSLTSAQIAPGSITLSSLSPHFLALLPSAGAGLSLVNNSLTVVVDPTTLSLHGGQLSVLNGSITAAQLADGAVDFPALSPSLSSSLASINSTAALALSNTEALLLSQSFLQQQLLAALNVSESDLLSSVASQSTALFQALMAVNASTYTALSSVNYTAFQFLLSVNNNTQYFSSLISSTAASLLAAIPRAGAGLTLVNSTYAINADPAVFSLSSSELTLQQQAITTALLHDGSVTSSKLAVAAIGSAQLAEGVVSMDKLSSELQSALALLSIGSGSTASVLSLGSNSSSFVVTHSTAGDLDFQAAANQSVCLVSADSSSQLSVSDIGVSVLSAGQFSVSASQSDISLQAQSGAISMAANDITLLASSSAINVSSSGISLVSQQSTVLSAASIQLNASASINITTPALTFSGSVQYMPATLAVTTPSSTIDFSSLPSNVLRLTGPVAKANLSFTGCSDATAGTTVTVYNQLAAGTLRIAAGSCGNTYFDILLLVGQRVAVSCSGLVSGSPSYECQRGEQAEGGLSIPSSTATILNNVVNGVAQTTTAVGSVLLSFTPATAMASLSFVISNPLLAAPTSLGAVLLTPQQSGTVNAQYASTKQSPLWVCTKQQLSSGQQLTVTVVNVGDSLFVNQSQYIQFGYQIL